MGSKVLLFKQEGRLRNRINMFKIATLFLAVAQLVASHDTGAYDPVLHGEHLGKYDPARHGQYLGYYQADQQQPVEEEERFLSPVLGLGLAALSHHSVSLAQCRLSCPLQLNRCVKLGLLTGYSCVPRGTIGNPNK